MHVTLILLYILKSIRKSSFNNHVAPNQNRLIIVIIMEIYATPKLSRYMTALGTNNIRSFTY